MAAYALFSVLSVYVQVACRLSWTSDAVVSGFRVISVQTRLLAVCLLNCGSMDLLTPNHARYMLLIPVGL